MNIECDQGTCQCRDEMKWNNEALECQIFMDVNCTDVDTKNIIEENQNEVKESEKFKFDDSEIFNVTDSNGKVNVSDIKADTTLEGSELVELNPNTTSKDDMRKAFCRDIARVARSYESNLVVPVKDNYSGRNSGGFSWIQTILVGIAVIAVIYILITIVK